MSNNINSTSVNTGLRVSLDQSRSRTAVDTSFSNVLGQGIAKGTDAALQVGQMAAPFMPVGSATVSAAITSARSAVAGMRDTLGSTSSGVAGNSGSLATVGTTSTTGTGTTLSTGGDMMSQMQQMQEMNQSFNMQYLALQQNMQNENRRYTTLSNIMKTKHDTTKNSISNIR